jgi:hypothetical protein
VKIAGSNFIAHALRSWLRWGQISITAFSYYLAVVYLTGLDTQLTTLSQFFGHALIYGAGVALFSVLSSLSSSSHAPKEERRKSLPKQPTRATDLTKTPRRRQVQRAGRAGRLER